MEADRPFQSLFRHPHIQSFNPYSRAVFADLAACHTWGQDLSFHPHSLSRISGSTASSARAGPTVSGGLKPNAKTTGSSFRRQAWPTCTRPCLWKFLKKMTPSAGLPTGQPYSKPSDTKSGTSTQKPRSGRLPRLWNISAGTCPPVGGYTQNRHHQTQDT